jgi:glycosyltransferase involved in cell wall biosynthesis
VHVNDIAHVASDLAQAQRAAGIDATVIDPRKPGGELQFPWKALTMPLRFVSIARVISQLRIRQPDIVHVHYATHAAIGIASGSPFLVHCHGTDARDVDLGSLKARYLRYALRRAAIVYFSTPDLRAPVARIRADAAFLPNPIDVSVIRPGEPPNRDVLLGVRLHPSKGAETAIEAVDLLLRTRRETTVTVVADGPLAVDARRRLAGRAEIVERRKHEDMPDLMRRHRIALGQFRLGILSQFELEAMACGLAVVAEFKYDGDYPSPAPIINAGAAITIAASIAELLYNSARLVSLVRRSRDWVVANHNADTVAGRVIDDYTRVLRSAH